MTTPTSKRVVRTTSREAYIGTRHEKVSEAWQSSEPCRAYVIQDAESHDRDQQRLRDATELLMHSLPYAPEWLKSEIRARALLSSLTNEGGG